jgi:hypothetical protein
LKSGELKNKQARIGCKEKSKKNQNMQGFKSLTSLPPADYSTFCSFRGKTRLFNAGKPTNVAVRQLMPAGNGKNMVQGVAA